MASASASSHAMHAPLVIMGGTEEEPARTTKTLVSWDKVPPSKEFTKDSPGIKFHGINPGRVNELRVMMREVLESGKPVGDDPERRDWEPVEGLSGQEELVGLLAQGVSVVQIFTKVSLDEQHARAYESCMLYWQTLMKASLTIGHFWFYRKQNPEGASLFSHHFALKGLAVPRWLVSVFEVEYDEKGMPLNMVPAKWSTFRLPKILCPEDTAFLVTLGAQRAAETQSKTISRYLTDRKADCTMSFTENSQKNGQFLVEVILTSISADAGDDVRLPAPDSRVVPTVRASVGGSTKLAKIKLIGYVTEDLYKGTSHFAVFCQGIGLAKMGVPIAGQIELIDDITTTARHINAMLLGANKRQDSGVDIGALLHLREPTQQEVYERVIDSSQPGFNNRQKQAAMKITKSLTGLELIVGPPGTGKTALGQTIVEGLAQCNYRVLVCASKHEAVEVAFRKFQAVTRLPANQFVRWSCLERSRSATRRRPSLPYNSSNSFLATPPNEDQGQRKIEPKDILLISPYTAQIQLIERKLLTRNIPGLKVLNLCLKTTSQAQGSEAPIVIVSLVRNDHENALNVGFVKDGSLLNVEMSRAKNWLFILGNFRGWMNEYHNHNSTLLLPNGVFKVFCGLLKHLDAKGDFVTGPHLTQGLSGGRIEGPGFNDLIQGASRTVRSGQTPSGLLAQQGQFAGMQHGGRGGNNRDGNNRGGGRGGGRGGSRGGNRGGA
ncbi:dna helicase [Diplodia corticola]|uniref:Dna helicase n=1 Tax=Diplodia corticola TaxID=236234 RepID=A0A1J9RP43_9PEZI|nr:dna helicase [Diplodia corticola]OJD29692.1 dna helicase [Diplodia corticola]